MPEYTVFALLYIGFLVLLLLNIRLGRKVNADIARLDALVSELERIDAYARGFLAQKESEHA